MNTQLQNREFIKRCKFETTMQRKEKQEEMYMYLHCMYSCICYYGIMITGKNCNGKFQQILWVISILKIKSRYPVKLPILPHTKAIS